MTHTPTLRELTATFAHIGLLSFGGAAGQIALMHRIVVEEKRWLDEARYLHALNYCMLLPGPEAQQLATYIGWLTHGVRGGLVAGILFVLPGALIMLALSLLYALGAGLAPIAGIFLGIKAAVLAIVAHAVLKLARRGLRTAALRGLALAGFAALFLLDVPFPLIVLAAGGVGLILAYRLPWLMGVGLGTGQTAPTEPTLRPLAKSTGRGAAVAAFWCLIAWIAPIAVAALLLGPQHILVDLGLFFAKLAVVTFGGAYAVLAYLAQAGVELGWVSTAEMIDGLGLAETTPGPTILVNQFVAFLAAWRAEGGSSLGLTILGGVLGAAMATWATFAPSFLWIFAGAPFVERLGQRPMIAGALAGITAAVVGVIAYVALWFGVHVLFGSVAEHWIGPIRVWRIAPDSLNLPALLLSIGAFGLLFGLKRGVMTTVAILALAGLGITLLGL